ncbi:MAG: hypothetical protein KBF45_13740 [Cyclobacteriaceae bacterium]|nr:hypothetical protein [Cyclobacteriaceae bacterium]
MSNPIDQLFKNKLGDLRATPSAEAWMKVEAGLSKKNNKVILWRIAAVLALFGLLTATWLYTTETNQQVKSISQTEPTIQESTSAVNSLPSVVPVETEKKNLQQTETKSLKKQKNRSTEVAANNISTEPLKEEQQTVPLGIDQNIVMEAMTVAKVEKPIVIEFTLDAITTETQQVAQAREEKSTGLKKIFDKALELKNGESDFGSLRDAKNELFALDFRKDKTKRN